jgi:hypothetical protein
MARDLKFGFCIASAESNKYNQADARLNLAALGAPTTPPPPPSPTVKAAPTTAHHHQSPRSGQAAAKKKGPNDARRWGAAALEPAAAAEVALGNPNDYYVSGYGCAKYPKTV